jgi:1,4-dihydroxy-2-naphthoate octaprenyltransferase
MNEDNVRTNSLKAWILASRPKTLTAALVPVIMACALAYHAGCFRWFPAVVCMVFAALMQIASNLINDLYDYLKGSDRREDRLGPRRAVTEGWITVRAMRIGIIAVIVPACVAGCLLVGQAGLWLVVVGALCVVFAFLYTTVLSYLGLGDVLVVVFFGLVPVCATYYIMAGALPAEVVLCSLASGIVTDTLLTLNNYRDRDADRRSGKRTLIVTFGERFGLVFYLLLGVVSCLLALSLLFFGMKAAALLPLLYLLPHIRTWLRMKAIRSGRALNRILGLTSRNILIFSLLLSAGIVIGW